jgi:hypothetical protein
MSTAKDTSGKWLNGDSEVTIDSTTDYTDSTDLHFPRVVGFPC